MNISIDNSLNWPCTGGGVTVFPHKVCPCPFLTRLMFARRMALSGSQRA
jgi:hypothetical protein